MRMQPLKHQQAGFTMVELLVTMVVMSILSLMLANFITNWLQASTLAQVRAELLGNAQSALDAVTNDIRLSGAADKNNRWPDDNSPSGQFGWESNSTTLVLAKAATDNQNNIIFSDPAKYITQKSNEVYYVADKTLYRRTLSSDDADDKAVTTCPPASATAGCPADKTVASGVDSFAITYFDETGASVTADDARSVQLAITLGSRAGSKNITASYTTRMVFRNE